MFEKIIEVINREETISRLGKIENVTGLSMEASGSSASIGDIVYIFNEDDHRKIKAEVEGFKGDRIKLMSYEDTAGIRSGSFVRNTKHKLKIPVGDFLKGRIVNSMGEAIDNERWHSREELELETMINILGVNRDKDKCKTH